MNPYVIWSPDYRKVSGGIRVLYLLGKSLRDRGYRAEMKMTHGPYVDNPWSVPECLEIPKDAIHVYPEIVQGNPSGSDKVVWWLLNKVDKPGLKFCWHPNIGDYSILNVPYIEPDVFSPGGELWTRTRSGVLGWRGKSYGEMPANVKPITYGWPATRRELADELRSAEYLISLDPYTAIVHEATLCGCPVVMLEDRIWDIGSLTSGPMKIFGVVDEVAKLDEALQQVGKSHPAYLDYHETMAEQLDVFIDMTQNL